jgi:hypothetical protein
VCDGHLPGRNSERWADALVARTNAKIETTASAQLRWDLLEMTAVTTE